MHYRLQLEMSTYSAIEQGWNSYPEYLSPSSNRWKTDLVTHGHTYVRWVEDDQVPLNCALMLLPEVPRGCAYERSEEQNDNASDQPGFKAPEARPDSPFSASVFDALYFTSFGEVAPSSLT